MTLCGLFRLCVVLAALLVTLIVGYERGQAASVSDGSFGFGYYSVQTWTHVSGKTTELSICDCDGDVTCFENQILFRRPTGGFIVVDRKNLHPESLKRIDEGLKKLQASRPGSMRMQAWRGKNGVELTLKLIAADLKMVAFVDGENNLLVTAIEHLEPDSIDRLVDANRTKHGASSLQFVAQVEQSSYEAVLRDAIKARKSEFQAIAQEGGVDISDIETWWSKVNNGLKFENNAVRWEIALKDQSAVDGAKQQFEKILFNDVFALLSLTTDEYERLKSESSVVVNVEGLGEGGGTGVGIGPGTIQQPSPPIPLPVPGAVAVNYTEGPIAASDCSSDCGGTLMGNDMAYECASSSMPNDQSHFESQFKSGSCVGVVSTAEQFCDPCCVPLRRCRLFGRLMLTRR